MTFDPEIVSDGDREYRRLKAKVKSYVKENLREYIVDNSIVGRKGNKLVKIPITGIRLPSFERDPKKMGGVGQGDGEEGTPLPGQGKPGKGQGAGQDKGEHELELEIQVDDILEILQEALELPNIQEKGKKTIITEDVEYTDLRKHGPKCLLDTKRTFKNALLRLMASGDPDYKDYVIEPDDCVYKMWKERTDEHANAVIFAIMDISGSMQAEQKRLVSTTMFWIEEWLKKQYDSSMEVVHIVHDTEAQEVSYGDFYRMSTGGGTKISSALKLCDEIIDARYPASDWNIYPFFFSDGDNQNGDDDMVIKILKNSLIEKCNQVCYGQVNGNYAGSSYKKFLDELGGCEKLCVYDIRKQEDILNAIKKFLGRGR